MGYLNNAKSPTTWLKFQLPQYIKYEKLNKAQTFY